MTPLLLSLLVAPALAGFPPGSWLLGSTYSYAKWLADHTNTPEFPGKEETFLANIQIMKQHNSNPARTYTMAPNVHSALTTAEYDQVISNGWYDQRRSLADESAAVAAPWSFASAAARILDGASTMVDALLRRLSGRKKRGDDGRGLPRAFSWNAVKPSVVTPAKNQGRCGSCWAFASTEVAESTAAINSGLLFNLSTQQLVSCSGNPQQCGGAGGCAGSTGQAAYAYAENAGFVLDAQYPYTSGANSVTGACIADLTRNPVVTIKGFKTVAFNDANALLRAVKESGPVVISVAAGPLHHYSSGILSDNGAIMDTTINHAVVITGWGRDAATGLDYYEVRNSWGTSWGENGYVRVASYRNTPAGEPCGIDTAPADGSGCPGGPATQTVCGVIGLLSNSTYPTGVRVVQRSPRSPRSPRK